MNLQHVAALSGRQVVECVQQHEVMWYVDD